MGKMRMTNWAGVGVFAICSLVLGCGGGSVSTVTPPPVNAITGVTLTPTSANVTIGATVQFSATVNGTGTFNSAVTLSLIHI